MTAMQWNPFVKETEFRTPIQCGCAFHSSYVHEDVYKTTKLPLKEDIYLMRMHIQTIPKTETREVSLQNCPHHYHSACSRTRDATPTVPGMSTWVPHPLSSFLLHYHSHHNSWEQRRESLAASWQRTHSHLQQPGGSKHTAQCHENERVNSLHSRK